MPLSEKAKELIENLTEDAGTMTWQNDQGFKPESIQKARDDFAESKKALEDFIEELENHRAA